MKRRQVFFRLCALGLCLLFCMPLVSLSSVAADNATELPSMDEARAVWLSHLESGRLVASKAENTSVGAGSSVKVMSGLLLCELFANKNKMYDRIYIGEDVWRAAESYGGYRLDIEQGDEFTAYDLLYAAICGSYNNTFYILAYYITNGSIEAFVDMMNARATALGMNNTYFEDVTGVAGASRTTARDMATLATVAYQNADYMTLCDTTDYACSSAKRSYQFYNNNSLVCQYKETKYYQDSCHGMSAGSTTADGNCVVTIAKHDMETYVCVVLGGTETSMEKFGYRIANRLVDWVYETYSYVAVVSPDINICTVPVTVSDLVTTVRVRTKDTLYAYLPTGAEYTYSIRLTNTELEAPFEDGTFVGYVAVIYDGRVIGTASLYTVGGAERSALISSIKAIKAWTQKRAVIAGIFFFLIACIAWGVAEYILWRRRRHKWDKYFSDKMKVPDKMMKQRSDPNRLRDRK